MPPRRGCSHGSTGARYDAVDYRENRAASGRITHSKLDRALNSRYYIIPLTSQLHGRIRHDGATGQTAADSTRILSRTSTVRFLDWEVGLRIPSGPADHAADRSRKYGCNVPVVPETEKSLRSSGASMYERMEQWKIQQRSICRCQSIEPSAQRRKSGEAGVLTLGLRLR